MLQAELRILGGKHQGKMIPLNTKKFLVGREQDCHLRPNSDLVSRHHCVFSIDDYAIRLRDLGSTNGTLVNGANLRGEVLLKSGDRVTIGKLELEVFIRQSVPQTRPADSIQAALAALEPEAEPLPLETPAEMPTQSEEVETSYEMPVFQNEAPPAGAPPDTAIVGNAPQPYPQQPMMPGYPQQYPQMMPGYPMNGGYMPPQYPQYPPGYGQPGFGQPMGYQMGYPQMMPMQPQYPMAAPAVATQETAPEPTTEEMAVRLPDPSETGVKPATPPAAAAGGAAPKKEEKPSNTAADIIKQYMNRR